MLARSTNARRLTVSGTREISILPALPLRFSGRSAVLSTFVAILLGAIPLSAQEFRIDSEVFVDNEKKPVSENLTLFQEGVVYDFRFEPGKSRQLKEVVVFRISPTGQGDFVFLDVARKVRFSLDARTLLELVDKMRTSPELQQKAPEMLQPEFNKQWEESTGWLTLSSDRITYRATGTRTSDSAALDAFHLFANWYARLNAAVPQRLPPFPRLALNEATHNQGMIPEEVHLTIQPGGSVSSAIKVRSKHYIVWTLSKSDNDYIRQAQRMLAEFRPALYENYFPSLNEGMADGR